MGLFTSKESMDLIKACRANDYEAAIASLDSNKANINVIIKGESPLLISCKHFKGCTLGEELIRRGADVNIPFKEKGSSISFSPLSYCIKPDKLPLAMALVENNCSCVGWDYDLRCTLLHKAIQEGFEELALLMLNKDPACRGEAGYANKYDGKIALLAAVDKNYVRLVKLLLTIEGTPMNYKDSYGRTALSIATENGSTEILRMLRNAGAS
jgi:ankyrin repeat protein